MSQPLKQAEHNAKIVKELTEKPELIENKLWRMKNLYWIITKSGTKQLFTMNRAQEHFFMNYLNDPKKIYHRHIILKSRQLGFTTFIDLHILDEILFNTNREGIIIAHKVQDATEIFDRKIDFAIRNMSDEVKGAFFKLQRNSAKKIQVVVDYGPDIGSTSAIQVATSGRSGTFFYVHISEFAKMCVAYPKAAQEVETGTFPAVPFDGFIFIESTAEGMAGRFYEMFHANWTTRDRVTPMLSRVEFLPHFYNWQYDDSEMEKITEAIPIDNMDQCEIDWAEYQKEHNLTDKEITYYYMKYQQMGGKNSPEAINKLHQEFPTTPEEAFLATGQTYFPTSRVFSLLSTAKKGKRGELLKDEKEEVIFRETGSGSLEIFTPPVPGRKYIVGGDTSEGLAHGDAQIGYVIDQTTEECVALYKSQVPPDEYAIDMYNLGKYYNWALLGIEANKDGLWVNDSLDKMGYVNMYYRRAFDDITKQETKFFGWKTMSNNRYFMLAALKAVFLRKSEGFPADLLNEMVTFLRNAKGKGEALAGKHDDVVMAASIAYSILQEKGVIKADSKNSENFSHMAAIFGD